MASPHLELDFDGEDHPRLIATLFQHPELHSLERKPLTELRTCWGQFSWSPGPKALAIFLLKVRLRYLDAGPGQELEYRFHDLPEQTLGEALRRIASARGDWRTEIFGYDSGRNPLMGEMLEHGYSNSIHSVQLILSRCHPASIHVRWGRYGDISHNSRRLQDLLRRLVKAYFPVALHDFLRNLEGFSLPPAETRGCIRRDRLLSPLEQQGVLTSRTVHLLALTGGSGFGKSFMARELAGKLSSEGDSVLWVRWEPTYSIAVLASQLRQELRQVEKPEDNLRAFRSGFPTEDGTPEEQASQLGRHLARHHVHVVLDNLDPPSEELPCVLTFLETYRHHATQGKVIVTTRKHVPALMALMQVHLTVPALMFEQTRAYFTNLFPEQARLLPEEHFRQLQDRSRGNFHRIRTLGEKLSKRIGVVPIGNIWDGLVTSQEDSLEELSAHARRLLELLAACRSNSRLDYEVICALVDHARLTGATPTDLIVELHALGMLSIDHEQIDAGKPVYLIPDPTRELIEESLARRGGDPVQRQETHRWLARYYGQRGAEPAYLIESFYHWVLGGCIEKGYRQLIANEKFLFDLDYTSVLERCMSMAKPALPSRPASSLLASEKLIRGRIAYYHGRYEEALPYYDEVIAIIRQRRTFKGHLLRAGTSTERRRSAKTNGHEASKLRKLLLPALEQRGLVQRKREAFTEAQQDCWRCFRIARKFKQFVWQAHALTNLGMVAREEGDCDKAIRYLKAGLKLRLCALQQLEQQNRLRYAPFWSRELARVQLADQYSLLAFCALEKDDLAGAERNVAEAERQLEEAGEYSKDNYYRGRFLGACAFVHAQQGHWEEALTCAQESYEFPQRKCNEAGELAGQYCLGIIYYLRWVAQHDLFPQLAQGWLDEAARHLQDCLRKLDKLQGPKLRTSLKRARVYRALSLVYVAEERPPALPSSRTRATTDVTYSSGYYADLARQCAKKVGKDVDRINPLTPMT